MIRRIWNILCDQFTEEEYHLDVINGRPTYIQWNWRKYTCFEVQVYLLNTKIHNIRNVIKWKSISIRWEIWLVKTTYSSSWYPERNLKFHFNRKHKFVSCRTAVYSVLNHYSFLGGALQSFFVCGGEGKIFYMNSKARINYTREVKNMVWRQLPTPAPGLPPIYTNIDKQTIGW